jgi:hypothetical protein
MRITSGGQVVIGNTVPSNVGLTIYGSNAATIYQTANTGTGAANGFYVGHTGDISYVWNYNNYPLVLATNNTERMRITSTGAIGIKNTSPSDFGSGYANMTLGSSGNIGYFSVTNGTINVEINADGGGNVRTRSNHDLVFGTNETARARITAAGIACFACQILAPRITLNNCSTAAVLSIGNSDSTNDAGVRGLSIITDRLRFGVSPITSTYGAIATNGTNSGITFVTYDNSWSERVRIECTGVTTFACQVCSPILIAGSVLAIQGNCSAGICFYKDYSGSPGNPGMTIYNNSGTLTFQHNSNGGTTSMQGNVRINGVGNQLTFDTTDGSNTIELGTVSDYVFRLRNYRGVGTIMDLGNNHIDFYSNGSLRQRISDVGITCFACQVCASSFSTQGFIRANGSMKTFAISKNFGERQTNADYFRMSAGASSAYQVMIYSVSQNVGVGWNQSQLFHASTAPYWGGWIGTSGAVSTLGNGSGYISSAVIGNDGTITFRVTTGDNGTSTTGTILSYIQVTAFNIDNVSITAL